jgi:hypothetical protein
VRRDNDKSGYRTEKFEFLRFQVVIDQSILTLEKDGDRYIMDRWRMKHPHSLRS